MLVQFNAVPREANVLDQLDAKTAHEATVETVDDLYADAVDRLGDDRRPAHVFVHEDVMDAMVAAASETVEAEGADADLSVIRRTNTIVETGLDDASVAYADVPTVDGVIRYAIEEADR